MKTTVLASCGGEATKLTVLVYRVADPVDAGVTADGLVEGVDHDHLEPLVNGVLVKC